MSVSILKKSPPAPDERLLGELNGLAGRLDQQQLWWASGYLAGLAAAASGAATAPQAPATAGAAAVRPTWTVFYATETGNSRGIAAELATAIQGLGFESRTVDLAEFKPAQLKKETRALFVVATHGLGEAPDGTEPFFEFLLGERAPRLESLEYSVLALGDSSYEDYCETGRQLDARLEALGARRLAPRVECDVDFEESSAGWQATVLDRVKADDADAHGAAVQPHLVTVAPASYSRRNPFPAAVLANQPITGLGSSKTVRHVVLSLEDSGLTYEPGDSLGVWPTNPPALVGQFLELLSLDADERVVLGDDSLTLGEALAHRLELTQLGRTFLAGYAERFAVAPLQALLEPGARVELNAYLADRQIIDVLADHPVSPSAQDLVEVLKRLTPRLYSISSSLAANPDEVHVTVAVVRYDAFGRPHFGSASNFLADFPTKPGATVPVFIAENVRFRLPADEAPVVMIGAGTGVAPYRAFLEERDARSAAGDNWLFFGDRNFDTDFLYQLEWARMRKQGLLGRHDVAFSRDQAEKVYVQNRIRQRGADLFAWLERGAHVYVCGDAKHMAPDVHEALLDVIEAGLGADRAAAEAYLETLKQQHRYQRDVY
ncbi:MAG: assimilatory sulfite reductase (NADPH) flavoprotein subunit [Pseudomonadales bacterium]